MSSNENLRPEDIKPGTHVDGILKDESKLFAIFYAYDKTNRKFTLSPIDSEKKYLLDALDIRQMSISARYKPSIFSQTDKAMYKPGDEVQFK